MEKCKGFNNNEFCEECDHEDYGCPSYMKKKENDNYVLFSSINEECRKEIFNISSNLNKNELNLNYELVASWDNDEAIINELDWCLKYWLELKAGINE